MKDKEKKYLKQITNAKRIAIIAHKNPDADAIGSCLALKRLIKQNLEDFNRVYEIDVFIDVETFDDKYKPLVLNQTFNEQRFRKYDLAIALDCSSVERFGKFEKIFTKASDTLNIDHHETNTNFAKNNIVVKKCSSTCELLYILFLKSNNWKCSSDIYSLMYSGIITDTNNLTQNIGINTLSTITDISYRALVDNVNLEQIRDHFFKSNTPEQISLLTRALDSINFHCNGQIATMKINKTDFAETNTSQEDTLGIVDYATKLQGIKIGILFIKQEDNSYYVSLRSKEDIDVSSIAKAMNGGGHKNIAAFSTTPRQSLSEVKDNLFDLCKKEIKRTKKEVKISDLFVETVEKKINPEETQDIEDVEVNSIVITDDFNEQSKAKVNKGNSKIKSFFNFFKKSKKSKEKKVTSSL